MKNHSLKTAPRFFDVVESGIKTFELRLNDCDFQVGDMVILQEYYKELDYYSGRMIVGDITYIYDGDDSPLKLIEGYCCFSFKLKPLFNPSTIDLLATFPFHNPMNANAPTYESKLLHAQTAPRACLMMEFSGHPPKKSNEAVDRLTMPCLNYREQQYPPRYYRSCDCKRFSSASCPECGSLLCSTCKAVMACKCLPF